MMLLINPLILDGLMHQRLVSVLDEVIFYLGPQVVTSLYRKGSGIHGQVPLRAVDLRCRHLDVAKAIMNMVNSRWEYDPERPEKQVAIAHDVGMALHVHLQVHDNTRRGD